ncbi:class I SAM-dependent methyltransferase [Amycolatopsis circi]|uniref:class I SAM-dependent methyltransferase n=1 Tax=Amycolatopsis circi TaxID=871959 RepID=UPI000E2618E0|nr:class I SAM-dependent methyltransferase [Amycolatopsis circi]
MAAYDEIADWYEEDFPQLSAGPEALRGLLREGSGLCLEIGCGTGVHADLVRELGWTPLGVDLSGGMLRHARTRLPIAQADAARLPIRDRSVAAVVAVLVHTDMPAYFAVLHEVARVLRPDGVFVHVGVHPCFCGGFADRGDPAAVVLRPGYLDGHWTKDSWTDRGIRDKVGAAHWPLPELMNGFIDAGLTLDRFAETGDPLPIVLAVRARVNSGAAAAESRSHRR